MSDIVVGIKLKADGSGLVGQMTNAKGKVTQFGTAADTAGKKAKGASTNIGAMSAASGTLSGRIGSLLSPIGLLTGGIGSITLLMTLGIRKFVQYSDEMTNLTNQLKLVTGSSDELASTQTKLLNLANQTRSGYGATVELYTKMFRATKDLNVSQDQLLAVTKAVNQSFQLSGASSAEAEGSTRQLAQALASGAFRGDEFNSVAEQAPRLMEALAAETGKTTGELREMAAQGELTSEVLIKALVNQSEKIASEYAKLDSTIGQASTVIGNNMRVLIQTFNDTTAAGSALGNGLLAIGNGLADLNNFIASGALAGYLSALADLWTNWGSTVESVSTDTVGIVRQMFEWYVEYAKWALKLMGTAFLQFPQNVRAMVSIVAVELASLVDVGYEYGNAFGKVVGVQLANMVDKAGIYAKELADIMAFWDGDTYDSNAAIAQANTIAAGMTNGYLAAAEKQVTASRNARLSTIKDILATRNAALDSFDAQIAKANALAAARHHSAANDDADSPDKIQGEVGNGQTNVSDSELQKLRDSLLSQEAAIAQHLQQKHALLANAYAQGKIQEDEFIQLSLAANQQYHNELDNYNTARANLMLTSGAQIFGSMADLAKTFGSEQSKTYKTLFAVQKGFAIAQGTLNFATALSNASAAQPWQLKFTAMAEAAASGAQLMSAIKGANYAGQAHDGLRRVDNEGTYVVRRDEMVLNPKQRDNFEKVVAATTSPNSGVAANSPNYTFAPVISIDATNATPGMEDKIKQQVDAGLREFDAELQRDFATNGQRSRMLRAG